MGTAPDVVCCEGAGEVLTVPLDGDGSGVVMVLGGPVGVSPLGTDISGVLVCMVGARVVGSVRGLVTMIGVSPCGIDIMSSVVVMGVSPCGMDIMSSVVVGMPRLVSYRLRTMSSRRNAHMQSMARPRRPPCMALKTYRRP
jgi:hypothetical protein